MSMLAERKRKTKWVINPTKKPLWTTDSEGIKFGKGLMEKMGWSAGKGLGVNEQGIQEPLKVSYKNDTKGMGFKGNDDDWIEHQDEFNSFLNQLRSSNESFVVKGSDAKKIEVKSLEEKSKWSKARVHYQKFTRGKDLSKYSENDLACILGTNKTKSEKPKIEGVTLNELTSNNNTDTHFGVTTINSGSIEDYFKKKWIVHKKAKNGEEGEAVQIIPDYEDESFQVKSEKKSKEKVKVSFDETTEDLGKNKKKKKRKRELNSEDEIENKRKKNDVNLANSISEEFEKDVLVENNNDCNSEKCEEAKEDNILEIHNVKEKKKKEKNRESTKKDCIENGVGCDGEELLVKKKKKYKKEKHLENDEDREVLCDVSDQINVEVNGTKKKKKKKKDKSVEKEETENSVETELKKKRVDNTEQSLGEENISTPTAEVIPEVESIRKKKKKKDKAERLAVSEDKTSNETKSLSDTEIKRKKSKKKDKKDKEKIENSNKSEIDLNEENKNLIDTESEPVKKKKKSKKDKEFIQDSNKTVDALEINQGELSVELESDNKKKKKHKKEKLIEEEIVDENPIKVKKKKEKKKKDNDISSESCSEKPNPESEKTNTQDINVEINLVESVIKESEKKNNKNHTYTKKRSNYPLSSMGYTNNNYNSQYCNSPTQQNNIINNFLHSYNYQNNNNNNNSYNSNLGNCNVNSENGVQNHKMELLSNKIADKFYPGQNQREKILRLIHLSDFSKFKGSNLEKLTGYGFLIKKGHNKPL